MSSINPMFVLPAALAARGEALAQGFVDSLTLGVGQFCTNPGLVLAIDGAELDRFLKAASAALTQKPSQSMLTAGIASAYGEGVAARKQLPGVENLAEGTKTQAHCDALPVLFKASAAQFLVQHALSDEIFGPTSVVVACRDEAQLARVAEHLEGQLTATLHIDRDDYAMAARLMPVLERKAGRILANGFPTGVEVSYAMVHGGPFPATSDPRATSVGAMAIERFLRPVCYQDLPAELLPATLQNDNPLALWRLRDGELVRK